MENNFFAYLQQLEGMAFFSGYPLLYAIVFFIAGMGQKNAGIKDRLPSLLPFSYALVGTLYLGLQLKNLYPDYSIENLKQTIQQPYLILWGLLSIFFWIPVLAKKPVLSLLHSLVFFFFLVKELFLNFFQSSIDKTVFRTEMKIYTDSLILNTGTFALIILISFLLNRYKKKLHP